MFLAYMDPDTGSPWGAVVLAVIVALGVVLVILLFRHLWRSERGSRAPAAPPDPLDRLNKLAALRDQGALSDEEYEAQKLQILGPPGP